LEKEEGKLMKTSSLCASLVVILCLSTFANVEAQDKKMYSWTDENGTVHFTDTRPEGQDVEEISVSQETPPVTANPYQENIAGSSLAEQRRQEIARKSEQNQINQAVKSVECSSWQAEVDRLEPNRRVFYTNDEGETERMDDVERTNRVAELKSRIANNCK
jgi:hypothetical protein